MGGLPRCNGETPVVMGLFPPFEVFSVPLPLFDDALFFVHQLSLFDSQLSSVKIHAPVYDSDSDAICSFVIVSVHIHDRDYDADFDIDGDAFVC